MKLLLINASPHGENSKTLLLARRFIRGLTQNLPFLWKGIRFAVIIYKV